MTDGEGAVEGISSAIPGMPMSPAQARSFADGAAHMLGEARSGHWAVDEETGTHLRSAIANAKRRFEGLELRVGYLQRAPKLGNDEYAQRVAEHMRSAMDSDDRSLVPVFHTLMLGLDNLLEALNVAMRNYEEADAAAREQLGQFKD
jgi:hypothetical protein